MNIKVDISAGELLDKITILQIKSERISDVAKLKNIRHELDILAAIWSESGSESAEILSSVAELKQINEKLWDIEDDIRLKESEAAFDQEFIELARSVYFTNDQRAKVKRDINQLLGSELVEEKSYADYSRK